LERLFVITITGVINFRSKR